jgi:hypothetical protein
VLTYLFAEMNPSSCPWACSVARQQIGQAARAVRYDGEHIDQVGL